MKRQRHQKGSLKKMRRAGGGSVWILRYRATGPDGKRVFRQTEIGPVSVYPNESAAQKAADSVRLEINNESSVIAQQPTVAQLIDHYSRLELPDDDRDERKAWSTKDGYRSYLRNWINPRWGDYRLPEIKTIHVEDWLRSIPRLEDGSKAKIRSIMSAIFNHAIRHDWLAAGRNPIALVRQGAQRKSIPETLVASEIKALWSSLAVRERAMVSIEYSKGLRVSEAFGLKFSDFDFENLTVRVQRGFVKGHLGRLKTEASKRLMPLDPYVAQDLLAWRAASPYPEDDDFIFASLVKKGSQPLWPQNVMVSYIRPVAMAVGITKKIGWHTFRHTYSTLLKANGEDVKTVQELMRHASARTSMDVYTHAVPEHLRAAQSKLVSRIRSASDVSVEEQP